MRRAQVPALAMFAGTMLSTGMAAGAWAAQPNDSADQSVTELVVTGSRIVSNGFSAPTPVTVLSEADLKARAPGGVPDALRQLPQFRNSSGNGQSSTVRADAPNQGSFLNLRNLGTQRSLILLDGVRVPPTHFTGGVDLNTLPQALISRVDVVTGGASAAYGSDAVVGAINLVLDKNFSGIKGGIQGGISKYGDGESNRYSLAAGRSFAGGRGHVEGSLEYYNQARVAGAERPHGDEQWSLSGQGTAANPFMFQPNGRFTSMTFGGLIKSGPLNNNEFRPDGTLTPFVLGTPTGSTALMIGGSGAYFTNSQAITALRTEQAFGRVSYDLLPNVNAFLQASWAESVNRAPNTPDFHFAPAAGQLEIFRDNAFLRPEVVAAMGTTQSFIMGRLGQDTPISVSNVLNNSLLVNAGLTGSLAGWNWDASYVHGESRVRSKVNESYNQRLYAALDAVRDPSSGAIVCRVALTNPGRYPGCVPLNYFGAGAPSKAALDYIYLDSKFQIINKMDIVAANISGDVAQLWAGPLAVAFGAEYREQKLDQDSNGDPGVPVDYTGIRGVPNGATPFKLSNTASAHGQVKVKEAYAEVNLPLLRDIPFVQELDLNAAGRVTHYSTSGTVKTWKVGASYRPFNDLRFRGTVSQDIAAPSLYQLYAGRTVALTGPAADPHTGVTGIYSQVGGGNDKLTPEKGSMIVGGIIYTPSFVEGLTISVDRYALLLTDAIQNSSANQQNVDCENSGGTALVCSLITRPLPFSNRTAANFYTEIRVAPLNLAKIYQVGYDFELSYKMDLQRIAQVPGTLDVRVLGTYTPTIRTKQSPLAPSVPSAGQAPNAKWSGQIEANYRNGPLSVRVAERFTGSFVRSFTQIYPENSNGPNVGYTDLNISYRFGKDRRQEGFLNVQNVFNVKPPLSPAASIGNAGLQYPVDRGIYDAMGAYFTAGVRFRL
jgi:outer membrane receptor protein involved in Fe transport